LHGIVVLVLYFVNAITKKRLSLSARLRTNVNISAFRPTLIFSPQFYNSFLAFKVTNFFAIVTLLSNNLI
jgi:hypothetical protein